jgi:hypothetical protein
MIEASCHCGNVRLSFEKLTDTLTSCNCSICNRIGALWAYYKPEQVSVSFTHKPASKYIWGDKCIEFYHCESCGSTTHYELTDKCAERKLAINCRMLEPNLINSLPVRHFDGANTWEFLD